MEAERINTIANQLADLSNRVNELRGYLGLPCQGT